MADKYPLFVNVIDKSSRSSDFLDMLKDRFLYEPIDKSREFILFLYSFWLFDAFSNCGLVMVAASLAGGD